jgi:hypothetical protein
MQIGRHPVAVVIYHITYVRIICSKFSCREGARREACSGNLEHKREPSQHLL